MISHKQRRAFFAKLKEIPEEIEYDDATYFEQIQTGYNFDRSIIPYIAVVLCSVFGFSIEEAKTIMGIRKVQPKKIIREREEVINLILDAMTYFKLKE